MIIGPDTTISLAAQSDAEETTPAPTNNESSDAKFTAGQMAAVGAGVGVPLLLALLGAIYMIIGLRRRLPTKSTTSTDRLYEMDATMPPPRELGSDWEPKEMANRSSHRY